MQFISLIIISFLAFANIPIAHAKSHAKVLIIGDSLSAAFGIKVQESWPQLLQKQYEKTGASIIIINASISGETTFGGKNRAATLFAKYKPDILVLELGGNDGLRGLNIKLSRQNLKSIMSLAKQQSIKVLLVGVRLPPNLGARYNTRFQAMYQTLSDEMSVYYLSNFLLGVAENDSLMQQDGIHPTAEAQPILAQKVFKALNVILQELK